MTPTTAKLSGGLSRSPRFYVALATGLFLATTATHFALRSEAGEHRPAVISASPAIGDTGLQSAPRFSTDWWQRAGAVCPDGTELRGSAPPEGREVWCARPDGSHQGPDIGWHPDDSQAFRRSFHDGVLDGEAIEWYPSGQVARRGHYRNGVRYGQWARWNPDGTVAEVSEYDARGVLIRE